MKPKSNLFIVFVALTVFLVVNACNTDSHRLNIVDTIEEYQAQVAENPDILLVDLETYIDGILLDILYATGKEIPMPTDYDEFTERAHPEYMDFPEEVIANRNFLFDLMAYHGFTHYPTEWWHFDYNGWEAFPLMDLSFEELISSF